MVVITRCWNTFTAAYIVVDVTGTGDNSTGGTAVSAGERSNATISEAGLRWIRRK